MRGYIVYFKNYFCTTLHTETRRSLQQQQSNAEVVIMYFTTASASIILSKLATATNDIQQFNQARETGFKRNDMRLHPSEIN